jgi:hypothetical protein
MPPYITPPAGFLCYNNKDLIRDGFIYRRQERIIDLSQAKSSQLKVWERRLKRRPPKGITYKADRDENGTLISIIEKRQLLPAERIKLWIKFSKTMKSALRPNISPGWSNFPTFNLLGGSIATGGAAGGITSAITNLTYQLCDAETKINKKYIVTKEIKESGIIEIDGYPLSIFGIVREHVKGFDSVEEANAYKTEDASGNDHPEMNIQVSQSGAVNGVVGLDFTSEQLDDLGKFSSGSYEGVPSLKITGATDSFGRYGGKGLADVQLEEVLLHLQEDVFLEIIKDPRTYKFRADNIDASGAYGYPFSVKDNYHDITNKSISIDTTNLSVGDVLYATISIASERRYRQCIRHDGRVGQGNTYFGLLGWTVEVGSIIDAFDYTLCDWMVPKLPPKPSEWEWEDDSEWKFSPSQYLEYLNSILEEVLDNYEAINGWRLSSVNSNRVQAFWAADYRGILLVTSERSKTDMDVEVIYPASSINDQEWFIEYLKSLDFTYPTGPLDDDEQPTYTMDDLQKEFDNTTVRKDRLASLLFDISVLPNILLFDREKIPYYQPFAVALGKIDKYDGIDSDSGVGLPHLDLKDMTFPLFTLTSKQQAQFDLSLAVFNAPHQRPYFNSCDEPYDNRLYYDCHIYNASNNQAVTYPNSYVENTVFGWRPPGGTIQSFWQLETPYFCGNFNSKSRVYIESMGGNSLNNFSLIEVETIPSVASNICASRNNYNFEIFLVFMDEISQAAMAYHDLSDGKYFDMLKYCAIDINKTNEEIPFGETNEEMFESYNKSKYIGYTKVLGEFPTYNYGAVIDNSMSEIINSGDNDFFESVDLLDPEYGLDFSDEVPKVDLPNGYYVKDITIEYSFLNEELIIPPNKNFITLYFEGSEGVISNVSLPGARSKTITIDCKYYYGGPIRFISDMWEYLEVNSISATATIVGGGFSDYKMTSGQMSIVNQEGKQIVFYTDGESGNISVVVSLDEGKNWIKFSDIIRLLVGESASLPFAIYDEFLECIHLFFVLNDSFIMYKEISLNIFAAEDVFVEFVPKEEHNAYTDIDTDDIDLEAYSDDGKHLRSTLSYFIEGDPEDSFFVEQETIIREINEYNKDLPDDEIKKKNRFGFRGDKANMKKYEGNPYAINIDSRGIKRLFLVNDGKLAIKSSGDFVTWDYLISDVVFHKDFFDDALNEGTPRAISNIQVVNNTIHKDDISILYFAEGMLLVRSLQAGMLTVQLDYGGAEITIDDTQIVDHLTIEKGNSTNPVFIIGEMPENIRNMRIEEMDNNINYAESAIAIKIPYLKNVISKFDSNLAVDDGTQAWGETTKNGVVKVFYRDSLGNINTATMNGNVFVVPELMYYLMEQYEE